MYHALTRHEFRRCVYSAVIHILSTINLAEQVERYYNDRVLSRAELFCLCMFVQRGDAILAELHQRDGGKQYDHLIVH